MQLSSTVHRRTAKAPWGSRSPMDAFFGASFASTPDPVRGAAGKPGSDLRKKVAGRLGISNPAASTDDLLKALDARLAEAKSTKAKSAQTPSTNADDALYELAFGRQNARSAAAALTSEEALYSAAWGPRTAVFDA